MVEARTKFRAFVFGIVGIIIALLVFRVTLDLLQADAGNIFVSFINAVTDFLIEPFKGLITFPNVGGIDRLNVDAIVAMGLYILGAIAFTEIVTAFMYNDFEDIFINLVDGLFKIVEFFIFLRIVFEFFGVYATKTSPAFVSLVYDLTEWTQVLSVRPDFLNGVLDISAIVVLIIVVVLDLLTERFLESVFESVTKEVVVVRRRLERPRVVKQQERVIVNPPPAQVPLPPQNITINVPMPPTQPQQVIVQPPPQNFIVNPVRTQGPSAQLPRK